MGTNPKHDVPYVNEQSTSQNVPSIPEPDPDLIDYETRSPNPDLMERQDRGADPDLIDHEERFGERNE